MSCGHLCFFYFTFPAHLRYAPMYRVTQKSWVLQNPVLQKISKSLNFHELRLFYVHKIL